jgi:hypothetical protein
VFTPATKAAHGEHDENVPFAAMVDALGAPLAGSCGGARSPSTTLGAEHAASVGLILADTKLEFGLVDDGPGEEVLLIDEVLTPDSSRYWPADRWAPGGSPPSFDKQYVRDHVTAAGWDRRPPAPALPEEVVAATRARYVEAYERVTGTPFSTWWPGPDAGTLRGPADRFLGSERRPAAASRSRMSFSDPLTLVVVVLALAVLGLGAACVLLALRLRRLAADQRRAFEGVEVDVIANLARHRRRLDELGEALEQARAHTREVEARRDAA